MEQPQYFNIITSAEGVKYLCLICTNARPTKDYRRHQQRPLHRINATLADEAQLIQDHDDDEEMAVPDLNQDHQHTNDREEHVPDDAETNGISRVMDNPSHDSTLDTDHSLHDDLVEMEANLLASIIREGYGNPERSLNGGQPDAQALQEDEDMDKDEECDDGVADPIAPTTWYPFKNKMDMVGSLLVGHTHSMMSRTLYTKVCGILTMCDMHLPSWQSVRESRARIRNLLGCNINTSKSVFNTPCFALSAKDLIAQDLANPLVSKHIDFYPENSNGKNIYKFSQSLKWLQGMDPKYRTQMCEVDGKHFYIFEPVQLISKAVVVPIYLYMCEATKFSKCLVIERHHMATTKELSTIRIPANLAFDDPQLCEVNVEEFDLIYSEFFLGDGQALTVASNGIMYEHDGLKDTKLPLQNQWRQQAGGKILRNVPITLYADDTSGNTSKQFNKHILFYFTLSGLPPHISNQEYNCHFLSTTNIGTVLEMSEQIVEELNHMSTIGYPAYDISLGQHVWVMSVVLCFLADSPMHAEVTNTPNPCRMCQLSCESKKKKSTLDYVQRFLHLDAAGVECANQSRDWATTRSDSHHLYSVATKESMAQFKKESLRLGIKDAINIRFLTESKTNTALKEKMASLELDNPIKLHNPWLELKGFDGVMDTPVEALHVILLGVVKYMARDFVSGLTDKQKKELVARLHSFNCNTLNIDSLKPEYLIKHILSIVGRDFKIILQAAPFVFFGMMSPEKKTIWAALCRLTPLIFQTHIACMSDYLHQLKLHVDIFLFHLIKSTAQWINKPKVHMLRHFAESIHRFGPASLFSTEKFKSYNGVLRQGSIHSNKQAPGRDLAICFDILSSLKFVSAGGWIYDKTARGWYVASTEVTSAFSGNIHVQRAMGYNSKLVIPIPPEDYPIARVVRLPLANVKQLPTGLEAVARSRNVVQRARILLGKHEEVGADYFVVVRRDNGELLIGLVDSIWEVRLPSKADFIVKLTVFHRTGVDLHYEMCRLVRTSHQGLVNANRILGCINVQHNCHLGECTLAQTKATFLERQATGTMVEQVEHSDLDNYVVNSASLHNPDLHRAVSGLPVAEVSGEAWKQCMVDGLHEWGYPAAESLGLDGSHEDGVVACP
ncbi:hypothetical protein KEM48_009913 [Puccinia striiformis f. sp. tritici PST-130]|uniref:Uncharacterized protein n=1 Tax=Puccinia striiformis f. sp. tritici PST-78 TaxID=1165861 RepID=A0A0L0W0I2_9BASI|nr:hypothetical protein KEM48_009913 [Puccinia striiformis f. sp. tritici PST-130]KNF05023.1 hypothetical protein PSTG_01652 [Puccinia striiformis f. sp. tritici PST-78]